MALNVDRVLCKLCVVSPDKSWLGEVQLAQRWGAAEGRCPAENGMEEGTQEVGRRGWLCRGL